MTNATLESIALNIATVRARMVAAAAQAGRDPAGIRLLAVSKAQPVAAIEAACEAGQMEYGENYLQEALPKLDALRRRQELVWHFIGSLQGNKTRTVAERFAWVHTVDRERIARRLHEHRPPALPPLNVCIEVRLSDEPNKSGIPPEEAAALAQRISAMPRLRLRGLMTIPPPAKDADAQRLPFRRLGKLFDSLNAQGYTLDTLSMGMSGDFAAAIAEGATLVRVGTAIFGRRAQEHS